VQAPANPWIQVLIQRAENGDRADASSLAAAQYAQLVGQLPSLACCLQSVAGQFRAINPGWPITPQDIEVFLRHWCTVDIVGVVKFLFSKVPGAGLNTLPIFNQILSWIQATCYFDPQKLDWTSQQFVNFTVWNQNQMRTTVRAPTADLRRSAAMQTIFQAVCGSMQHGLIGWVRRAVQGSRANFFVTVAIESAMSFCPDLLPQLFQTA
jgi:hypothetical protein